jgi:hypothetical protein
MYIMFYKVTGATGATACVEAAAEARYSAGDCCHQKDHRYEASQIYIVRFLLKLEAQGTAIGLPAT